jgi:hypothetical protein
MSSFQIEETATARANSRTPRASTAHGAPTTANAEAKANARANADPSPLKGVRDDSGAFSADCKAGLIWEGSGTALNQNRNGTETKTKTDTKQKSKEGPNGWPEPRPFPQTGKDRAPTPKPKPKPKPKPIRNAPLHRLSPGGRVVPENERRLEGDARSGLLRN